MFDSGCGTGQSTARLAERHPEAWVIGIDKSLDRLGREGRTLPPNARLVRAELGDFWRCAQAAGWRLAAHYLPYPNPWPKARHYKRRWPAHPAFPALLGLGGALEVRSNWRVYLEEWQLALGSLGIHAELEPIAPETPAPLSPFEAKYLASGHACYRLAADLGPGTVPRPSWLAYQARCEAADAWSRPVLETFLAVTPAASPLRPALEQALAAPPLRKPAGHKGDATSDFFLWAADTPAREQLHRALEQAREARDDPRLAFARRALETA